jgi:hypothetical protein
MLGRAFYLSKDYQHCVATLENYLTGSKVTNDNIDYYWMLALAYEQVGKLSESKDMMLKIRSVNMEYRDISRRLSNIDSRISMGPQAMTGASVGSGAQTQHGDGDGGEFAGRPIHPRARAGAWWYGCRVQGGGQEP